MFRIIPKEESFFLYFDESASNVVKGAKAVKDMVADLSDVDYKAAQIKEIEHKGDEITYRTIDKLNRTFVTPIDREDIHALVTGLDNILDLIDQAASLFSVYKLKSPSPEVHQMCVHLVLACEAVHRATHLLKNARDYEQIIPHCREVQTQEKNGDAVIRNAMRNLFEKEKDAIQIIKWKEVFEDLENALDQAQDVANIIEGILIKLS